MPEDGQCNKSSIQNSEGDGDNDFSDHPIIPMPAAGRHGTFLFYQKRQQGQVTRPLDGGRQLALFLGGNRSDAARHDLAALGHIALQQLDILIVNLRRAFPGKRAGLAAAEKRAALCVSHYSSPSLSSADVSSAALSESALSS